MSEAEVRRAEVLSRVAEGELGVVNAAEMLGVSNRQGKRLWKRYREEGARGLVHRSAGRRSNRARPEEFREKVLERVQMDGSFHRWLEERGPELCLMHMVDDASGTTLSQLREQETLWAGKCR